MPGVAQKEKFCRNESKAFGKLNLRIFGVWSRICVSSISKKDLQRQYDTSSKILNYSH